LDQDESLRVGLVDSPGKGELVVILID